jgi:Txe/YoeB family toxin of Txe-Axe toxin-antitoxin module
VENIEWEIRITENKVKEKKVDELMDERKELKYRINQKNEDLEEELKQTEKLIANECAEENRQKVIDSFQTLAGNSDLVNTNGMWNIKKKVFPKISQAKPTGKKNSAGQIITSPEGLKNMYLETYKHRLRHRPIKEDLEEIKTLKVNLFYLRLNLAKQSRSETWDMKRLDKVLLSLKTKKARDPHGLVNDLFKPGLIGADLKLSLLKLLNLIKETSSIPEFAQWANITSLFKGKGDRLDLSNDRGIFLVTVIRSILMKMMYNDKYDILDQGMSDSNVGARRGKNIRNHIFIINGIINDVLSSKSRK